ncbi:hypothetical protein [Baekduia sp.]|jgi:hypothetical protein|uniref:hypothetical protein n=1 Tax=Baekduia sp. TaxID=2600305 RepID=UPI002DFF0CBD|nr:hypothetical protein [Baekduia sp.]
MPTATATYDHATAVADIVAGYYRTEMALRRDDTRSLELKHLQEGRVREEDRFARQADQPAEERAHRRRADKAAYLRDKLAEAEKADRAVIVDPKRPS